MAVEQLVPSVREPDHWAAGAVELGIRPVHPSLKGEQSVLTVKFCGAIGGFELPMLWHDGEEILKKKTLRFGKGFRVIMGNRRVQAAQMVIAPGDSEGGPANRHRGADQWLLVVGGTGTATVSGCTFALKRHSLLLIEHGERHEIKNTGSTSLETINFYSPPAYTKAGVELAAGKS